VRHSRAARNSGTVVNAVRQFPRTAIATTALTVAGFLFLTVSVANAGPQHATDQGPAAATRVAADQGSAPATSVAPDQASIAADRASVAERAKRSAVLVKAPARPVKARAVKAPPAWVKPMTDYELTSCYEYRTDPYPQFHKGIDFANKAGTPIRSVHAGKVIMAGDDGDGYGKKVVVDHGDGTYALYGHGSRVKVHEGQRVRAGQVIAHEGSSGDSTGPHLHFEIWKGSEWHRVEPAKFLRAHGVKVGC
jgi:murein DD-endopeptidase MepM/ murein hydrolase activator NlpD